VVKKITIIGGSGFVGTNFCRYLDSINKDFEIIDLKLSNQFSEKCKIGDVRDLQSLRNTITGDVVVNLAAIHRDDVRDKSEYYNTNVVGMENICSVCSEKKITKLIYTSSVAVYGFVTSCTDENGKIEPFNEYGKTKFLAEEKLRSWQAKGNNSLIIVRPTVIFGEGNRGNVFNLFNQISTGKFLMIGSGKNKKSLAYIENVVAFLDACVVSNQKYGLYNYVDTPNMTMNDFVSLVRLKLKGKKGVGLRMPYFFGVFIGFVADITAFLSGRNLSISSIRIKKFTASTEFSSSKHELDGFVPPYKLNLGITKTLESEFSSRNLDKEIFFTE